MASQTTSKCFPILKSVCVFWKIIGLCPFVLAENAIGRLSYGCIFYTTIITLAYGIIYYHAVVNRMTYNTTQETPMTITADFLGLSTEFILIVSAWLYVILRHDQLERILKTFKKIQETSKIIDISQDFQSIFRTIKVHTIAINITWIILYSSDHIFMYDKEIFKLEIWLPFNLPRIVSHNIVLMFIDVLWILKKFFCSLNDKVKNLSREDTVILVIPERNRRSSKNGCLQSFITPNPLEIYGQLHSDLVTVTKMIVDFFSLSITLFLLVNFILTASDLYLMCIFTWNRQFSSWRQIAIFADLCGWWCLHFTEIIVLIAISDSTINEANQTGRVLHTMLTIDHMKKYVDSAQIFSLQLLQKYLNIELYGLFEVKLSVIHKIMGMVITYVTIMMQLDSEGLHQQKMQKTILKLNTSHTS